MMTEGPFTLVTQCNVTVTMMSQRQATNQEESLRCVTSMIRLVFLL